MKKIYTLLSAVALTAISANAQNLIPNGNFESWTAGVPTGYTVYPDDTNGGSVTQETTDVHGGTSAARFTAPAGTGNVKALVADFAVTEGHTYTLSYWYKDESNNARGRHWGVWRNASGAVTPANTNLQPDYYPNTTGWQQVNVVVTAPATATTLRFDYRVYQDTGNGGTILLDDLSFTDNAAGIADNAIAGLKVFPNPLNGNVLNITSDNNALKTIAIYDVLGKQVVNTTTSNTTINVNLTSGVYMVKITEEGKSATRKLVVK